MPFGSGNSRDGFHLGAVDTLDMKGFVGDVHAAGFAGDDEESSGDRFRARIVDVFS